MISRHGIVSFVTRSTLLLALSAGALACGERDAECAKLDQIVTKGTLKARGAEAAASRKTKPADTAKSSKAYADTVAAVAKDIGALALTTPELKGPVGEYQALITDVSAKAQAVATAYEKYAELKPKWEKAKQGATDAHASVKKACEKESPDCEAVAKLGEAPDGKDDKKHAADLDAYVKKLDALDVSTAEVKAAAKSYADAAKAYATELVAWAAADAAVDAAEKALDEAMAKDAQVTQKITAACAQ